MWLSYDNFVPFNLLQKGEERKMRSIHLTSFCQSKRPLLIGEECKEVCYCTGVTEKVDPFDSFETNACFLM